MKARALRWSLIVMSCLITVGISGVLAAEEIDRKFQESFAVKEGMKLILDHGDGDVRVTAWRDDRLDVEVRYRAKASNIGWVKSSEFRVDFRQDGDTIFVTGHEPKRVSVGISAYREYEYVYEIKAPSYLNLNFEGEDGDVEISDWRGEIEIRLEDGDLLLTSIDSPRTEVVVEDGDVEIDRLRGEILVEVEDGDVEIYDCQTDYGRIRGEDGDVTIDRCSGSFEVTVADGDAHLSELVAADLEIRGGDGTILLALLPSDDLDLNVRVGDGDVVMDLDRELSASFELETRDGRIQVQATDVADLVKERQRVSGRIGGGDGSIYVRSVDGDVTLRR